jgi:oligopeptide/dipeptide ABC transporter ATP-binding protein
VSEAAKGVAANEVIGAGPKATPGKGPATGTTGRPLLEVDNLRTYFATDAGDAKAVDGISFSIQPGKTLAIVGESGCGKTVTALSILQLIPMPPGRFESGAIRFDGQDLTKLSPDELRKIRGGQIAMIFQEPATSLNPVFTIGDQIAEAIRLHRNLPPAEVTPEVIRALKSVRVSDPERRLKQYPHEMSGGMRQRVMIAMALACQPRLLIADEPTTAVDVTIQARILELLDDLRTKLGMSILLITHDLGVVAETADDVVVMYAGQVIEQAPVMELFDNPRHPYTQGLFASLPRLEGDKQRLKAIEGSVPAATRFPPGCRFRERCPHAQAVCEQQPQLVALSASPEHRVACWLHDEIARGTTR